LSFPCACLKKLTARPFWLCWEAVDSITPMFVRTVGEAALIAYSPDYEPLRPVLVELKRRYEVWRVVGLVQP